MFASALRRSVVRPALVKRVAVAAQFSSKAAMSDERIPSTPIVNKVLTVDQEKVQRIVDEVLSLNLLEVVHFTSAMEKAFDLPNVNDTLFARLLSGSPATAGGAGSAAPAAASAAAAAPVPEAAPQKVSFDLKLESFGAGDKIKIIKLVREMSGLGLKEAKEKVEGAPTVLMKDLTKEAADEWLAKLTTAGGKGALE